MNLPHLRFQGDDTIVIIEHAIGCVADPACFHDLFALERVFTYGHADMLMAAEEIWNTCHWLLIA
jgi:hypothetical protein